MTNVIEFRKRLKASAPKDCRYVMVVVDTDGGDGFIEHSDNLNGYEVLGILDWGKSLKLAETVAQEGK